MAESPLSSDLEQEASPPRPAKSHKKADGMRSAAAANKTHKSKSTTAMDKVASRRHKALKKQYNKAKQAASASLGLGEPAPLTERSHDGDFPDVGPRPPAGAGRSKRSFQIHA